MNVIQTKKVVNHWPTVDHLKPVLMLRRPETRQVINGTVVCVQWCETVGMTKQDLFLFTELTYQQSHGLVVG